MTLILTLTAVCILVGVLLGFVGAGGAGVMVSLLTLGFHLPIHQAVGTSLAAMFFVTLSGSLSHFREGNTNVRVGILVGASGVIGAVAGAGIGQSIPEHVLRPMAGIALWVLAALVFIRSRLSGRLVAAHDPTEAVPAVRQTVVTAALSTIGGVASAFFGVGMTPYFQVVMLTVLRMSLVKTIGTTMLALIFISAGGGIALATQGDVSLPHLVGATIGMTIGSYVGAKFTRRAPLWLLRSAIVLTPFTAGTLLLLA